MKRSIGLLLLVAGSACDRPLSPDRRLVSANAGRYGDFILPIRDIAVPDTMSAADSVDVYFAVEAGVDPCAYSTSVLMWDARVTYVVPWGVNHPGSSCIEPKFRLIVPASYVAPDSVVEGRSYYHAVDPVYRHVVICRPDGSFSRRDIAVRMAAPTRNVTPSQAFSIHQKRAESTCANARRWALSG